MRRRRRRQGARGPRPSTLVAVLVAVGVALALGTGVGFPAAGFDVGTADRSADVSVTDDATAAHALDVAPSVAAGRTSPLVNVTNRLEREVTVTVSLAEGSRDAGSLVVDGTTVGNETSLVLARGATQRLSFAADADAAGRTVRFAANATGEGLSVTAADRSTEVT